MHLRRFLALAGLASLHGLMAQISGAKRPLTIDDVFRRETLSAFTSPDGELVLYIHQRAMDPQVAKYGYLHGSNMSDGWLISSKGGDARKVFSGGERGLDSSQYYWSPD